MAEKQLAYRTNGKDEIFAEDDPLAELARIVGFEPRSTPSVPASQRHEPAFDLEDELLREFERYDAPRLSPIDDIAIEPEAEPLYGEAAYTQPGNENVPRSEPHSHVEPEFAELPSEVATPYAEAETPTDAYDDAQSNEWIDDAPLAEISVEQDVDVHAATVEPAAFEPSVRDLADELELSIDNAAVRPAPRTPQWAAASIRLPLANFNAARKQEQPAEQQAFVEVSPAEATVAPESEHVRGSLSAADIRASDMEHDFEQRPALGFPTEQDRHEDVIAEIASSPVAETPIFDLAAAAENGDVHPDAALTEPAYEVPSAALADDFDDLLADVSRYPVPLRADQGAPKVQPDFGTIPVHQSIAPAAFVPEPAVVRAEPAREEVNPTPGTSEDPFADQDFDFDFEGIEMELAGLDFTEPKKPAPEDMFAESKHLEAARAEPTPQRSMATPLAAPRVAPAIRSELAARPASAPILTLPPAPPVPVEVVATPVATIPTFDNEQPLPFDPSEITETEDRLETFDGKNVPVLPHVEKDEQAAAAPEYDFDIDAELANLFHPPSQESAGSTAKQSSSGDAAALAANASANNSAGKQGEELDEFERALEDDFRRSFNEPQQPAPDNVARMTLESSSETTDRRRARSMRGIAAAAAAVLVLGAGAYGVYGFLFHGSSLGLSSGEPRVIAADKEPIKVVPENPGGKVVPNQDKAVYDRVAGDATQPPKQKQLVSSNEQPVDVVQKTLIPEAMSPDDSDGANDGSDVTATPVGETEDPRLLPGQSNSTDTATAASDQENVPSVSPRKVRTMIVKPDGTLVARDEPTTATDTSIKAPATTTASKPQLAPPAVPAATQAAKSASAANRVASTDLRATNSDSASASASPSTIADAADSDAASAESTPIRVVKTSTIGNNAPAAAQTQPQPQQAQASDTAPVPSARPTQAATAQKAAPAPKQTEVAVATPPAAAAVAPKQTPAPVQKQVAVAKPVTPAASTAPASAGGYVMQIASLPSEEEAKRSQANLTAKFASIIGGHSIEIRKADIAGKGTYYRVRVAAGSKDDAAALCVRFRAAGGTCLISK